MSDTSKGNVGFGVTIAFASGFCAEIIGVSLSGMKRNSIDVSHNAMTELFRLFVAGKLVDAGELKVDLLFDPDSEPPMTNDPETCTVTFPKPVGGATSAATLACTAFLTDFEGTFPMDDKMTASATLKLSGKPTWTDHVA